ncbi:MAG: hypothetical protein SFX19_04335 [Alphaproteobacteria bacterium]|nr:hypothetical protein [Alphaproteobacteria bacterium]
MGHMLCDPVDGEKRKANALLASHFYTFSVNNPSLLPLDAKNLDRVMDQLFQNYQEIAPRDIAGEVVKMTPSAVSNYTRPHTPQYKTPPNIIAPKFLPYFAMALEMEPEQYRDLLAARLPAMANPPSPFEDAAIAPRLLQTARVLTGMNALTFSRAAMPDVSMRRMIHHESLPINQPLSLEDLTAYSTLLHKYSDPLPEQYRWYTLDLGDGTTLETRLWAAYHEKYPDMIPVTPPETTPNAGTVGEVKQAAPNKTIGGPTK